MSNKYIDVQDDESEDSLDGFIEYPKKRHRKHKRRSRRIHKRKRADSSNDESESLGSVDTDDDEYSGSDEDKFVSPVSKMLGDLSDYFGMNKRDVKLQITKQIKRALPNLPSKRTKTLTSSIIDHLDTRYLSVRSGTKPSDKAWRLGMERTEVEALKPILKDIRAKIKENMPTIPKILRATVPASNKTKAIEVFDLLQNAEPYTDNWIEYIKRINRLIKPDPDLDRDRLNEMDQTEQRLEKITPDHQREYKDKIFSLATSDRIKSIILDTYNQMQDASDDEHERLRKKLFYMTALPYETQHRPFQAESQDQTRVALGPHLERAQAILDAKLYGMDVIKRRIIDILHNREFSKRSNSILCLQGPPGVGKTAIASCIAEAAGVAFDKISAGGIIDPSVFKGNDTVWVGSQPGIIVRTLCKLGINNPVILLDELDKAGGGIHTDAVQNAIFDILDPEQNHTIKDMYLHEFDHDFSNIFWVVSVNNSDHLHPAIKSRLDIIDVEPYNRDELIKISRDYVIPLELSISGLPNDSLSIDDGAIDNLIRRATPEFVDPNSRKHYDEKPVDVRMIRNMIRSMVAALNRMETTRRVSQTIKRKRLTYDLDDFNGFPYKITSKTVDKIVIDTRTKVPNYFT
jgi:ATP-dependent Lon protease